MLALDAGRTSSTLTLYEVPGATFNTVLFEAAPAPFDPFDDEEVSDMGGGDA